MCSGEDGLDASDPAAWPSERETAVLGDELIAPGGRSATLQRGQQVDVAFSMEQGGGVPPRPQVPQVAGIGWLVAQHQRHRPHPAGLGETDTSGRVLLVADEHPRPDPGFSDDVEPGGDQGPGEGGCEDRASPRTTRIAALAGSRACPSTCRRSWTS